MVYLTAAKHGKIYSTNLFSSPRNVAQIRRENERNKLPLEDRRRFQTTFKSFNLSFKLFKERTKSSKIIVKRKTKQKTSMKP